MTDLDPLATPGSEGSDLPYRAGRELPPHAADETHTEMAGPVGREESTESVGDPDREAVESKAESGAGAGMLAGLAVAGPFGLPIGAAAGAAAGAGAEAADADGDTNEDRPMTEPASRGTGPVDPATGQLPAEKS